MIAAPTSHAIAHAARLLATGQLIGLPTETVYGLAADANNANAVGSIYATKGRPNNHPLIVHLAVATPVSLWASTVPAYAKALIAAYWPGPLTLVLPRTSLAADFITGQQATVALRCPSHPVAQQVLQACAALGVSGVAAPSANRFGRVSPTTAQHVFDEFANVWTLDGGACDVGIESTIVDCTQAVPRVLRHGAITTEAIQRVTRLSLAHLTDHALPAPPRVSGDLAAHYAPNTPLYWASPQQILPTGVVLMGFEPNYCSPNSLQTAYHAMPHDASLYAQQLYATLRRLDNMAYTAIAVQPVPSTPDWAGVADRLARAAATFKV